MSSDDRDVVEFVFLQRLLLGLEKWTNGRGPKFTFPHPPLATHNCL